MHSHYGIQATSHAKVQLSVHERIDDLHKRASGMAPAVEESAADSGCTDWSRREHRGMGPRQRMAWDMVAEALGWNAISDKPAMLAAAEQCERDGQPYYVGYAHNKPAEFTTALATETDAFTFGVWGHDQPLEVLPADDARELADTNALIDEISERHGLSTGPQSCGCWNATHLGSCIHQPADPWSAADLAASNAAQPQRAPWAVAEDFPQRASYLPAQPADCRCAVSWGSCPAHSHAAQQDTPERAEPAAQLQCCGTWIDYPQAGGATECPVCHTTFTVTATCPDELVSCEECSAPCDGTLTAYSELMGEDVPVCPNCHRMCTLSVPAVVVTLTLTDDAAGCPVHGADPCFCAELTSDDTDPGRHVWDIPSDYTGRHRNTDAAIDDAWLQRL
jgi:hypothetical protein